MPLCTAKLWHCSEQQGEGDAEFSIAKAVYGTATHGKAMANNGRAWRCKGHVLHRDAKAMYSEALHCKGKTKK